MQLKMLMMQNKEGLTAKNAMMLVKTASSFTSRIHLEKENKKIDAKSVMGVISLGVKCNENIIIFIDGDDEDKAMEEIEKLFAKNFAD